MHGSPDILYQNADLTWAIITGVCIAAQCALLSVLVVLKRMAFIGQGISHAALAGVGVAAILGITQGPLYFAIVGFACVAAALLVGCIRDRKVISSDTAIGIVLVASMALGVSLLQIASQNTGGHDDHDHAEHSSYAHEVAHEHDHGHDHAEDHTEDAAHAHSWEDLLFGSLTSVGPADAAVAGAILLITGFLALRHGRALLFWAFDERAACAFGAPTSAAQVGLMIALAATIVASMKLVGIILATALLVLPGACALRLSQKLPDVLVIALLIALIALGAGLAAASMLGIPVGGAVVLALTLCYALTWPLSRTNTSAPTQAAPRPERTTP